jgi:hypothetical protein
MPTRWGIYSCASHMASISKSQAHRMSQTPACIPYLALGK